MQPENLKPKSASIILLDDANRCLLFLRDNKSEIPYPNRWDLLGGQIEPGETAEQAVRREILEEIEVTLDQPTLFRIYDLPDRTEHLYWQRANLAIETIPLHEGQKLQWFSAGEIRQMSEETLAFGFRELLMEFFTAHPFPPRS